MDNSNQNYWNARASLLAIYKGEAFYTITALPYYIERRKILCNLLLPYIKNCTSILDFGCGDGWYLKYFSKLSINVSFFGFDISPVMRLRSYEEVSNCSNVHIIQENETNSIIQKFDLIYSIAVLAHITDEIELKSTFTQLHRQLHENGTLIFFEQTGPVERQWDYGIRRRIDNYIKIAEESGFIIEQFQHVQFSLHRIFFENLIAPIYSRLFIRKKKSVANRNWLYRVISSFFVKLTLNPIYKGNFPSDGNTLFIFKKF